jgi:hypothetical protein
MPEDRLTALFGSLCQRCGERERREGSPQCEECLRAPNRNWLRRLDQTAREDQAWIPEARRPPSTAPTTYICGRCQQSHALWTTTAEGRLRCDLCGWTP